MIENSIEELFDSINNSKEYKDYQEIVNILNEDKEVKDLIEEIKVLQKEATNLEYNNDLKYREVDEIIKVKIEELGNKKNYQEYLTKLKKFNNLLKGSSALIEEYVEEKVSI